MSGPCKPFQLGRYHCVAKIGQGGMAEVYRGEIRGPDNYVKPVAVKVIAANLAQNKTVLNLFINEAKITAGLSHGNIATVIDFDEHAGRRFMVMELIDGVDLREIIDAVYAAEDEIPWALAVGIVMETTEALHYAHTSAGVVHRDLSPGNIMLSRSGEVKILDFGVAKTLLGDDDSERVARGKWRYMSPEQVRGDELDARSDLFTLGAVFYEMLCGKACFAGPTLVASMRRVEAAAYERLEGLHPALEPVLGRLLTRDRTDRYTSARELFLQLARLLIHEGHANDPAGRAALVEHTLALREHTQTAPRERPRLVLPDDAALAALLRVGDSTDEQVTIPGPARGGPPPPPPPAPPPIEPSFSGANPYRRRVDADSDDHDVIALTDLDTEILGDFEDEPATEIMRGAARPDDAKGPPAVPAEAAGFGEEEVPTTIRKGAALFPDTPAPAHAADDAVIIDHLVPDEEMLQTKVRRREQSVTLRTERPVFDPSDREPRRAGRRSHRGLIIALAALTAAITATAIILLVMQRTRGKRDTNPRSRAGMNSAALAPAVDAALERTVARTGAADAATPPTARADAGVAADAATTADAGATQDAGARDAGLPAAAGTRAIPMQGRRGKGELDVYSHPKGARVIYAGKVQGVTPLRLRLAPGRMHNIVVSKPGMTLWIKRVWLPATMGALTKAWLGYLRARPPLAKPGQTALRVVCTTAGVNRIYLNHKDTGYDCPAVLRVHPWRQIVTLHHATHHRFLTKYATPKKGQTIEVRFSD